LIIAVTGLNTASEPASGYGVVKSLKKAGAGGLKIMGLAYEPYETSLYDRGVVDRAFLVSSPSGNRKEFIKRISSIKSDYGLDVLIPNLAFDIPAVAELAPELNRMGVKTLLPAGNVLKKVMDQISSLIQTEQKAVLPSDGRGANREENIFASLVKNPVQSRAAAAFFPDMFSTAILADRKSGLAGIVSIKKLLVSKGGSTWMGLTVETGDFTSRVESFIKETGWAGPMTINTVSSENGLSYISGIHPGFPDWINFAAGAGANLPGALIGLLTERGTDRSSFKAEPGRLFARMSVDIVTDIEKFGIFSLTGELES
jgi:hypothetical protein